MYVTNIQHFCVDDGPGIRTTIFLSGCNLRCKWCHNPENFRRIIKRKQSMDGKIVEIESAKNLSVEKILKEIEQDKKFYDNSAGGVTVSGGEPILQIDEAVDLLNACKKEKINTTVETALNYDFELIKRIEPYVDLFIVDCKAISEDVHIRCTGVTNKKILDNIVKMSREGIRIWVRIPVVQNVNITVEEIDHIANFLSTIYAEHIELIPYHKMGIRKYEQWGMKYTLEKIEPPTHEFMMLCYKIISGKCNNVIEI